MPLNDRSSLLSHLKTRRSGRPRDLIAPGPDDDQLAQMLRIAARTPDHGKIVPYRFVIIETDQRDALARLYENALLASDPDVPDYKLTKSIANALAAPSMVVLVSSPDHDHKIPVWEQELCCGAVGMNLLHAAHALGFTGGWITGWPSYNETVASSFCKEGERIAGLFYFGTPEYELSERDRPELNDIVSRWSPDTE